MELIRGGMKAPVAMDWVTAANIGSTGTAIVSSATFAMALPDVGIAIAPMVEIEFTLARPAGTGACYGWVHMPDNMPFDFVADNVSAATDKYTLGHVSTGSAVKHTVRIIPTIWQKGVVYATTPRQFRVLIRAKGTAADSEWTATSLQGRLIYVPI